MSRCSNSVPKYRKHRASGQAVVTLSGRDFYLGPHGSKASRAEYDRLIGEWVVNGRAIAQPEDEFTDVELSARYIKFAAKYYRKDGRSTDVLHKIKSALKYLVPSYGRWPATSVGPLALKAIRQQMVDAGLARVYVNEHIGRIRRMYKWAAGEELVPESAFRSLAIVDGLRRGRTEARETAPVMPVADAVVEATLEHMAEVPAAMVRLQRLTGMRPGEVCVMRPCDIDRSEDVWVYRPESHKCQHLGRERAIYLGPQAQAVLLRFLARGSEDYCFSPADAMKKHLAKRAANRQTPITQGNAPGTNRVRKPKRAPGDRYTPVTYRRAVYRACERAGVECWGPNRLRHTAATEVRKHFGLEAAQVVLGHSQATITQLYAERDNTLAASVARGIG